MNDTLSPRNAFALFVVVVLAWGINWSVTKQLVQVMPPLWASAIRSWIALAALAVILGANGKLNVPKAGDIPVVLSVGLLHMTLFAVLTAMGLRYLPAGKGIVLGYTTPLWVALATAAIGTEPLTARKLAGAALGLLGLGVILNPASIDWTDADVLLGAGTVILGAMCWAANIIYVRSHRWIASPLQLLLWQALVASAVLTVVALAVHGWPYVAWTQRLLLLFVQSGLVGVALAYWAMSMVNRSLPALTTSLGTTATPIVGIASAAIWLGEPVDLSLALATALIVGGIVLNILPAPAPRA